MLGFHVPLAGSIRKTWIFSLSYKASFVHIMHKERNRYKLILRSSQDFKSDLVCCSFRAVGVWRLMQTCRLYACHNLLKCVYKRIIICREKYSTCKGQTVPTYILAWKYYLEKRRPINLSSISELVLVMFFFHLSPFLQRQVVSSLYLDI